MAKQNENFKYFLIFIHRIWQGKRFFIWFVCSLSWPTRDYNRQFSL